MRPIPLPSVARRRIVSRVFSNAVSGSPAVVIVTICACRFRNFPFHNEYNRKSS
jgi:hypothetical protein